MLTTPYSIDRVVVMGIMIGDGLGDRVIISCSSVFMHVQSSIVDSKLCFIILSEQ